MNAPATTGIVLGQPFGGGFAYGYYTHGEERRLLIKAPKALGEFVAMKWNDSYAPVEGARSYFDGLANTEAMAAAGSELAKKIRALRIGDFDDWFLPAQDQLEPAYRILKPTAEKNWCFARSGINLSAAPQTWPYTPDFPKQTELEIFRAGGAEAFEPRGYWTSTEHAGYSDCAWIQDFDDGNQSDVHKGYRYLACAVRSVAI